MMNSVAMAVEFPHWVFPEGDARIQRYSPVLPLSRDAARIDSLRQALTVYRMVFGQPRQDDLLGVHPA